MDQGIEVHAGNILAIWWSNGLGYDRCEIVEHPDSFELVRLSSHEVNDDGSYTEVKR